jgi:hypothetical protein
MENFSKTESFGAEEILRPWLLSFSWKMSWVNGNQIKEKMAAVENVIQT